jgi:hypothetical protein
MDVHTGLSQEFATLLSVIISDTSLSAYYKPELIGRQISWSSVCAPTSLPYLRPWSSSGLCRAATAFGSSTLMPTCLQSYHIHFVLCTLCSSFSKKLLLPSSLPQSNMPMSHPSNLFASSASNLSPTVIHPLKRNTVLIAASPNKTSRRLLLLRVCTTDRFECLRAIAGVLGSLAVLKEPARQLWMMVVEQLSYTWCAGCHEPE